MQAYCVISAVFLFLLPVTFTPSNTGQQSAVTRTHSTKPPELTTVPPSVLDAKLELVSGRTFHLRDYEGKVLVVNLWATWLGPSQLETPQLVKLHKKFRPKGIEIVGLSTEDPGATRRKVRRWVRRFKVTYRIGWATADVVRTLMQGRDAIPQTFVVSRSGRIVRRFVGFNPTASYPQWENAIQEALDEKVGSCLTSFAVRAGQC